MSKKIVIPAGDADDIPDFIKELLTGAGVMERDDKDAIGMSAEKAVELLRETLERYQGPNPFKVGHIVTPRKGFNLKHYGKPHIVVEVLPRDEAIRPIVSDNTGSAGFGRRLDMRVLTVLDGDVTAFWVENWTYEFHELNES